MRGLSPLWSRPLPGAQIPACAGMTTLRVLPNILTQSFRGNDKEDIIVGSVRAYEKTDTCYIGKLIVLPEYQNKGIGKALMREIENEYKNIVKRYELFTGKRDPRNQYLYNQLGYKAFKTEKQSDEISFVYMEKSA